VNGYLLDTNVALIALSEPAPPLTPDIRAAMLAGPNYLSVVVYWEVMLKSMKQNLDVGDPRTWWFDALDQLAASPLPLRPEHIGGIYQLPPIHRDPFDRALIAQAIAEELTLLTTDREILKYASDRLLVIS
jgi:PIN domain nuclease of toxin-antitoxin system